MLDLDAEGRAVALSLLIAKLDLVGSLQPAKLIAIDEKVEIGDNKAGRICDHIESLKKDSPELASLRQFAEINRWIVPVATKPPRKTFKDTEAVLVAAYELEEEDDDVHLRTSQIRNRLKWRFDIEPVNLTATINSLSKRSNPAFKMVESINDKEKFFELTEAGKSEAMSLHADLIASS